MPPRKDRYGRNRLQNRGGSAYWIIIGENKLRHEPDVNIDETRRRMLHLMRIYAAIKIRNKIQTSKNLLKHMK